MTKAIRNLLVIIFVLWWLLIPTSVQGASHHGHRYQSMNCEILVITAPGALNLREGPGAEYAIVTSARKDDRVIAYEATTAPDGKIWYRVQFNQHTGWVSSTYVQLTGEFSPECAGSNQESVAQVPSSSEISQPVELPEILLPPVIQTLLQNITPWQVLLVVVVASLVLGIPRFFADFKALTDTLTFLCIGLALFVAVATLVAFNSNMPPVLLNRFGSFSWIILLYLANSLPTFILYAYDKAVSGGSRKRTPEVVLHFSELIGGWPGGLIARPILHHKTNWGNKTAFKITNWLIIFLHLGFWGWYFFWR